MASKENNTECMITCWGVAAFAGVVAMIMLYWMAEFGALQAIFTGGLIGTLLGVALSLTICSTQSAAADLAAQDKPAVRYAAEAAARNAERAAVAKAAAPLARAGTAGVAAGDAGVAAGSAGTAPGTAGAKAGTAGETTGVSATATSTATKVGGPEAGTIPENASDTTAPAGNWTSVHSTPSGVMSKPAAAPKKAAAAKKTPAAKKAPATKAKPAAKAKAAPKAAAADGKPALMLSAAREGGADDLKLISGVGPKLEQTLNDLGVYHFDQVAKFKKKDIAWVDERLRFKGRIERDDWMSQAKILAKGGETEFSKGKKKT